ncbi:hypothetical protein [Patulibacter sp.]|uniref:hypothetical protein n=1 Tax=Patulibacter sp. TaxID=1912859 RepID=UPI00271DDB0D|nr:hypothetical protein [Patulibacter sp.]MDO9407255.1 hypothetical protein [Patulibacter sp.]
MKAVFTALLVSLVFAVFFVLFLIVPLLVIAVGYFWMTARHKRLSRKAKEARNNDGGDDQQHPDADPQLDPPPGTQQGTQPGTQVVPNKPPLVESPSA